MANVTVNINTKVFNKAYLQNLDWNGHRYEIFYGGAGSGKSVFIAQRKVWQHLNLKNRKTLVIRKVGATLRHSAYAEITGVIGDWGLSKLFRINRGDMTIYSRLNNNQFLFTGLDNVEKMKSIKGITDIWIEEATEISREELQQLNLRLRGRQQKMKHITLSFNPVSALHWLKKFFFDVPRSDTLLLKTTYKDNRFLSDEDVEEIEKLKDQDPIYWKIYGEGDWGVLGDLVFTNYEVRDFDNNPKLFSIYNGLDWGFNEPSAGVKVGLKDNVFYILNELYVKGLDNPELMREAEQYVFNKSNDVIIADSAEPARIKEWRKNGWKIRGAEKRPDSVRFGIDFIRRHKVVIHPTCQNFLSEIQAYAYRKDKLGNTLEEPIDFNNHLMDAFRYAVERLTIERGVKFA